MGAFLFYRYERVYIMKKYIILTISYFTIYAQNSTDLFSDLTFRNIGPSVAGGRIHDVEVVPNAPEVIFIASASGGIWKSSNIGTTWKPVFDDQAVSTGNESRCTADGRCFGIDAIRNQSDQEGLGKDGCQRENR